MVALRVDPRHCTTISTPTLDLYSVIVMIYSLPYFQLFKLLVQLLHWFFVLYHQILFFLMALGTKQQWVLLFTSRFTPADQSSTYLDIFI